MADKEDKDKPYTTRPLSEEALEAQLNAEAPTRDVRVNPNPIGSEDENGVYVGTDPIYQNSSTVANQPFDAQEGVDQKAEERTKETYDLSDEDDGNLAEDYGFGGKATKAETTGPQRTRYLVPGQEGYDREKAEEQNGPPMRVDLTEEDDEDGEVATANNPGTNFGSTVNPPTPPGGPDDQAEGAGSKPAAKTAAKPS